MSYAPMICFALGSCALEIGRDRRDPYGVEPHALDIFEVIHDSLPRTTAIFALASVARRRRVIRSSEPVCDEL